MPADSQVLARRYVEFVAAGVPDVLSQADVVRDKVRQQIKDQKDLLGIVKRMREAQRKEGLKNQAKEMLMSPGEKFAAGAAKADAALGMLTNSVMGWVTAGMRGTVEAYQLDQQFTLLSRQVASVFKPTIDSVIGGVKGATNWFRNLSGEQQSMIRNTVEVGAVALGAVVGVNLLRVAVVKLGTAYAAMTGIGKGAMGFVGNNWKMLAAAGALGAGVYALHEMTKPPPGAGPPGSFDTMSAPEVGWEHAKRGMRFIRRNTWDQLFGSRAERDREREYERLLALEQGGRISGKDRERLAELKGHGHENLNLNQTGFEQIGAAWDRMANEVMKQEPDKVAVKLDDILNYLRTWDEQLGSRLMGRPPKKFGG